MKYVYKRKVSQNCDYWEDCKIDQLREDDIFYRLKGDIEGPFLTAKSNATLRPASNGQSKLVWHVTTERMNDENFL